MTFDLERIIESKGAWRPCLAQRPVAEKLANAGLAARPGACHPRRAKGQEATGLPESLPEYPLKPPKARSCARAGSSPN